MTDARFEVLDLVPAFGKFFLVLSEGGLLFFFRGGNGFVAAGQVALPTMQLRQLVGVLFLPFLPHGVESDPGIAQPAFVEFDFADAPGLFLGELLALDFQARAIRRQLFGRVGQGGPLTTAALHEPALELGDAQPVRFGFAQQVGGFRTGGGQFGGLLVRELFQRRSLVPKVLAGGRDLILQIEKLAPLVFEVAGELLFLPGESRLALVDAQFPLEEGSLLRHDGGGLNPQSIDRRIVGRSRGRVGVEPRLHADTPPERQNPPKSYRPRDRREFRRRSANKNSTTALRRNA